MAWTELYGLTEGKAAAWTGRAVTGDHLTEAEAELGELLGFAVRADPATGYTDPIWPHQERGAARAIAFLAAAIYDAEVEGEVIPEAAASVGQSAKRVSVGDVSIEAADGTALELGTDGQLASSGRVDWVRLAKRALVRSGLWARRTTGHTSGGRVYAHTGIVNDI